MKKKIWYEISITNKEEGFPDYEETILKVKSKGLAYQSLQLVKGIYENTKYTVVMK